MEIKCFKQSWQPVAKKQTFWKCLSALTQLWQDLSLTCGAPPPKGKKGPKTNKRQLSDVPFRTKWQSLSKCLPQSQIGGNDSNRILSGMVGESSFSSGKRRYFEGKATIKLKFRVLWGLRITLLFIKSGVYWLCNECIIPNHDSLILNLPIPLR